MRRSRSGFGSRPRVPVGQDSSGVVRVQCFTSSSVETCVSEAEALKVRVGHDPSVWRGSVSAVQLAFLRIRHVSNGSETCRKRVVDVHTIHDIVDVIARKPRPRYPLWVGSTPWQGRRQLYTNSVTLSTRRGGNVPPTAPQKEPSPHARTVPRHTSPYVYRTFCSRLAAALSPPRGRAATSSGSPILRRVHTPHLDRTGPAPPLQALRGAYPEALRRVISRLVASSFCQRIRCAACPPSLAK